MRETVEITLIVGTVIIASTFIWFLYKDYKRQKIFIQGSAWRKENGLFSLEQYLES